MFNIVILKTPNVFNQRCFRTATAVLLALFQPLITYAVDKQNGWKIQQLSTLQGKQTIFVRRDAIKIKNENKKITILMKAPDWTVHVWNDSTKVINDTPVNSWRGLHSSGIGSILANKFSNSFEANDRIGTMDNLQTHKVYLYRPAPERHGTDSTGAPIGRLIGNYWSTDAFALPARVNAAVQKYYGEPPCERYPLKYVIVYKNGEAKENLSVQSCEVAKIPDSEFVIPLNYKKVRLDEEVAYGADKKDLLEELAK